MTDTHGEKLTAALHEAAVYGIGATSDYNQRIILVAARQLAEAQAELLMWRASFPASAEAVKRDALSPPHAAALSTTDEQP
jgi:hypothetical protein